MEDVGPEKGGSAGEFLAARMRHAQGADLPGQAEHKEQGAIKAIELIGFEPSHDVANAVTAKRGDFVGHDLRFRPQTIGGTGLDDRPKPAGRMRRGRQRTDDDGRRGRAEFVRLHHDRRARLPQIARGDDDDDIAAFHGQSFVSRTASSQSSSAVLSG